ncbi:MAG: hypothetical protein IPL28_06495, partial [Chloroflexi bacterium]|nr:hypothetical protein [Chloroflexota bacterium]
TATADLGSTFVDWSGDVVSTTNPVTVTMDSDKFITATFSLNQYELNVATVGNGTAAPNSGTYDYGTVVTLTATADLGSTFTDWSGDVVSTTNPITITMDSDKFITATFILNQYELNVATVGNGTAAPNSGTYDYGTVVTLTATADLGSTFTDWSGDVLSTTNPVTVTMNSDKFITATFALTKRYAHDLFAHRRATIRHPTRCRVPPRAKRNPRYDLLRQYCRYARSTPSQADNTTFPLPALA